MKATAFTRDQIESRNEIPKPREPRCEILDNRSGEIWQACDPHSREWHEQLELDSDFSVVGYGAGHFDRHWFRRSPDGAVDGPLRTREFGGRRFFYCAHRPTDFDAGPPRRLMVDKHHSVAFDAGRSVELLRAPDGREFVLTVVRIGDGPSPELPEGWSLRTLSLDDVWRIDFPAPTETYWFDGFVSYQGPVDPPG